MADDTGLDDNARTALAAGLGLDKLARLFPDAFDRAYRYAQAMLADTPRPEAIADEPAHVFRAGPEA
ncbi:MAG: hypothetical protein QF893_04140 [Alphaproteobacteria bacterium]|jgi:hypothetical protein|nr:hypothetical protein [Alphaproteobacteria bacterium]